MNIYAAHMSAATKGYNVPQDAESCHLSETQLQFYWQNGFLILRGLIDADTLSNCKRQFVDICEGRVEPGMITVMKDFALLYSGLKGEQLIYKIQDVLHDPVLCTYSEHPRLVSAITSLLGNDLTAMNSMLINKPPQTGPHPPHQDQYYLPIRPSDKILGSWTAIDRVDRENGCLYLVPRSHRAGELYDHGYPPNAKGATNLLFHGISRDVAPLRSRLYLAMGPGDTVLFHPLLVHGSEPNVSQRYRKALSTHFAASSCRYVETRGTPHQVLTDEVEELFRKRGVDFHYTELLQHKCKQIKGVKCNL